MIPDRPDRRRSRAWRLRAPPPRPLETAVRPPEDSTRLIRAAGTVLANVTVITGLLVYFGWKRSETQATALGVRASLFELSVQDYVLRSVGPVFWVLAMVGVAALAAVLADPVVRRWAERHGDSRRGRLALRLLASGTWLLAPAVVVLVGIRWRDVVYVVFPLTVAAGLLASGYFAHLWRLGRPDTPPDPAWRRPVLVLALGGVVTLCLFVAAGRYAAVEGSRLAGRFAGEIGTLPAVQVYSPERLHITAPGSREDVLPAEESRYRYRYGGLRLLEHTAGKYFLVPDGWTRRHAVVVVLRDDESLRFEFGRMPYPLTLPATSSECTHPPSCPAIRTGFPRE